MTYRRTWLSYVTGTVYTGVCILLLSFIGAVWFLEKLGAVDSGGGLSYNSWWELAVAPVALISLLVVLYFIISEISLAVRKRWVMREAAASLWEALAVIAIFILGFIYRLSGWLSGMSSMAVMDAGSVDVTYYEQAVVKAGEGIAPAAYGAGYLYVLCLSAVLSFLGNKIMSAVLFQLMIQMLTMLAAYAVVRRAAGGLPACVVLLYLAFSESYIQKAGLITPECFLFLLYLSGMFVLLNFVKEYCSNRMKRSVSIANAVFAGIVLGVLAYLDLTMVSLSVFLTGLFIGSKAERVDERKYASPAFNVVVCLITLAAGAAAWVAAAYGYAVCRGTDFSRNMAEWIEAQPGFSMQWDGMYAVYRFDTRELLIVGIMIALASFLVFELFKKEKEQNYTLWIVAWVFIAPLPLMGSVDAPYRMESLFIWIVLAGIGLQNCLSGGRTRAMKPVIGGINAGVAAIEANERQNQEKEKSQGADVASGEVEKTAESAAPDVASGEVEKTAESAAPDVASGEVEKTAESAAPDVASGEVQKTAESAAPDVQEVTATLTERTEEKETSADGTPEELESAEADEEPENALEMIQINDIPKKPHQAEKPRYIENPLPLPKKHVKKEMDYQYTVEEKDMKYDIEVDENDDFDIL